MRPQEDELFERFQRTGRPELLGRVYDLVAPELLHVALHLLGKPAEAEDALQATFLVALEKARDWESTRALRPWLLGILAHQAQQARARAQRVPDPERLAPRASAPPGEEAEREELGRLLDEALFSLPGAYQPVLVLRLRHGLDPVEIAHALGRPPGTVRAQLSRGLERLRRSLPASLLGGWLPALDGAPRGLQAVRETIVACAHAQLPWYAAVLGGITMHKLVAVGSALVLAVLLPIGWQRLRSPRAAPQSARPAELATPLQPPAAGEAPALASEPLGREPLAGMRVEAAPATPAAAPQPLPSTGTLRVRVLARESGAPASDAWVLVEVFPTTASCSQLVSARSDEAGEALFADLPVGQAFVTLLQGEEGGAQIQAGRTATLVLSLLRGFDVEGEVVDDAGRPVPGAEIWLARRWQWSEGEVVARADGAGRFRFSGMSPDHALGARASGWAPSMLQNPSARPGEKVEVRLVLDTRSVSLTGEVRDLAGLPIAGADVLIGSEKIPESARLTDGTMAFGPPPVRARSNAEGRFRFDDLAPAPVPLQVRCRGYGACTTSVDPRASGTLVLTLEPGGPTLAGRVLDAEGRPAGAVHVHTDAMSFTGLRTWTAEDGSFAFAGLALGPQEVVAEKAGSGRAVLALEVEPGGSYRWDAQLVPAWSYRGTLEDAQGRAIEGWSVVARRGDLWVAHSGPSGPDGSFLLEVDRDEPHTLLVQAPGGWRELPRASVRDVRPSPEPLVIRVADEGLARITVTLLDADGAPAAGARLALWHPDERLYRTYDADPADGRIAVERVPAGTVQLTIQGDLYPWKTLGERKLVSGEVCDLGQVRLERGWPVTGEITGLDDELLERVVLTVGHDGQEATGVERHGRQWRTGALAPGRYALLAMGEGIQLANPDFEVAAGAVPHVELRLERAGVRTLILRAPGGGTLPRNVHGLLRDSRGEVAWMGGGQPSTPGASELAVRVSARPGSYRLEIGSRGEPWLEAPFEILGFDDGGPPVELVLETPRPR